MFDYGFQSVRKFGFKAGKARDGWMEQEGTLFIIIFFNKLIVLSSNSV
jgi:hypothetical protein